LYNGLPTLTARLPNAGGKRQRDFYKSYTRIAAHSAHDPTQHADARQTTPGVFFVAIAHPPERRFFLLRLAIFSYLPLTVFSTSLDLSAYSITDRP